MRARIGLITIGLVGCLCSALNHMAMPGRLHAGDALTRQRHSLIARPSVPLSGSQLTTATLTNPKKLTPLSLVTPIHPVREGKKPSSFRSIAGATR